MAHAAVPEDLLAALASLAPIAHDVKGQNRAEFFDRQWVIAAHPFEWRNEDACIVAGPGSGKTTLAHALAKAIRCPAICRDEFKEGIVNSLPSGTMLTDAIQRHTNDAFFEAEQARSAGGMTTQVGCIHSSEPAPPGSEGRQNTYRHRSSSQL